MGTNYFWRDQPCATCGRFNELHVCKSQNTWRAYRTVLLDEKHPNWGYREESPVGSPVLSLVDWRRVFTERRGELRDEYGHVIPDPLAWLSAARPWKPNPHDGRQYLDQDISTGMGWLDSAGFRFYAGEFC